MSSACMRSGRARSGSVAWILFMRGWRVSGSGTAGIGSKCSYPSSAMWNDAASWKMARPCWMATTRRVVNDRPSRMRSTS